VGFLGAVCVMAVLFVPKGASATHLTDTGSPGGPTVPWGFNEDWGWSNGAFSAGTAGEHMQLAGAIMPDSLSANRFHVQWADVEPTQGTYDWTRTDAVYAAMQQYTPDPILMLFNAPAWARDPAATCPSGGACGYPPLPAYDSDWQAFVQAAVARYPDVRAIEVWNEPNLGIFWAPAADPARYSALLTEAHTAVAAAGSSAPVLTGGLIPATTDGTNMAAKTFLEHVYDDAGATAFEGIGAHPYPHKAPYVDVMWNRLDALRGVRDANSDTATPLWITEVGISTEPTAGVPPD
jgi:polysaccharide biosynthesis protein PslG